MLFVYLNGGLLVTALIKKKNKWQTEKYESILSKPSENSGTWTLL